MLFFIMFVVHYFIWQNTVENHLALFRRYYIFVTLLFLMVVTVMNIFKNIYPDYLGFVFMGLILVKLSMMFIILNKLKMREIPHYQFHFILPYLISLFLETLYSINLIKTTEKKDEKNHG